MKKVGVLALQGDFDAHVKAIERAGYQPGEQVSLLFPCCSKVTLQSPVAEAWNPRGWPAGAGHRLSVRITPAGNPSEIVVYIRVAFLTASGEQIYYPPSGSRQDQQGAPVLTRTVKVGR